MNLNYFYNAGSHKFKGLENTILQNKKNSFLTGDIFKSFVSSSEKKLRSIFISPANYSLDKFFTDSLDYSINRINEIKKDLVVNPISSEFEKVSLNSKFSFKKFLTIGAATIALQMGATAIHDNVETNFINSNHFSSLNNDTTGSVSLLKGNSTNLTQQATPSGQTFNDFFKKSISNSNPVELLRQDTPQVVVKVPKFMQSMFKTKEEAFLNLLNVAEGKQDKFYRDNKGIALAYGWNPTRNTKEFNLEISKQAGLDEAQTAAIIRVSNTNKINFVPKDLKKMRFTSSQVDKIALALMPYYEKGFLDAMTYNASRNGKNPAQYLSAYKLLPNNQQVVMIHMAYKVGGTNLMDYKTFYKKLFNYIDKPTKVNLNQIQNNFQYTFANLDGQRLHDIRVEKIHTSYFSSCAISPDLKAKENVSAKITQCRNIANITNPESVQDMKVNVAGIQSKMSKMFS